MGSNPDPCYNKLCYKEVSALMAIWYAAVSLEGLFLDCFKCFSKLRVWVTFWYHLRTGLKKHSDVLLWQLGTVKGVMKLEVERQELKEVVIA